MLNWVSSSPDSADLIPGSVCAPRITDAVSMISVGVLQPNSCVGKCTQVWIWCVLPKSLLLCLQRLYCNPTAVLAHARRYAWTCSMGSLALGSF